MSHGMTNPAKHNLRLFWSPSRKTLELRSTGVNTEDPDDILAYQDEVTAMELFREELRESAQTATGTIHDLPQVEGAPRLIEKPWTTTEAGQRYVAWNVFAVDPIDGREVQLSKRLENIGDGVMWLEQIRSEREITRKAPPQENVDQGFKCEDCRRFSHEQGQAWLNQETHRFDKASSQMWRDVVQLVSENNDVEVPNSLEEFGACLEESKLVPRDYPGCSKYSPRRAACRTKTAVPGEGSGEPVLGR